MLILSIVICLTIFIYGMQPSNTISLTIDGSSTKEELTKVVAQLPPKLVKNCYGGLRPSFKKYFFTKEKKEYKIYDVEMIYHYDPVYDNYWWIFTHPDKKENVTKFVHNIGYWLENQSYVADWAVYDSYEDCLNDHAD